MIEDIELHDETLVSICLVWADATCIVTVKHGPHSHCAALTFTNVSNLTLPRNQPWGPSQSINSASQRNQGQYEIEMQSGDLIIINASAIHVTSIADDGGECAHRVRDTVNTPHA